MSMPMIPRATAATTPPPLVMVASRTPIGPTRTARPATVLPERVDRDLRISRPVRAGKDGPVRRAIDPAAGRVAVAVVLIADAFRGEVELEDVGWVRVVVMP